MKYRIGSLLGMIFVSLLVVNSGVFAQEVKKIKVGHAGTLDPLATGLMIICTGKSTREIESYQGMPKEYEATFRIGQTTLSFDLESPGLEQMEI